MHKKILFITFMFFIFLTMTFQVHGFQGEESFFMEDISEHWAKEDIEELVYMGILKGSEGKAYPDQLISRAEFTAFLVRALNYETFEEQEVSYFSDVQPSDWYYKVILTAKKKGIILGNGDGTFLPNNKITREEIVLILVRAMGLEEQNASVNKNFKDINKNYPYKNELNTAINSGVINGYEDNTFRPYKNASRAEAAAMIKRILETSKTRQQDETIIKDFIKEYIKTYNEDKNNQEYNFAYNLSHSIGKENHDISVKSDIFQLYKEKDLQIKEKIDHIQVEIVDLSGQLAKAVVNSKSRYERKFQDNTHRIKSYNKEEKISLIKVDNQWKVYYVESRLYTDEKINLVWEQMSVKQTDMSAIGEMKGLDVISPTWFEIADNDSWHVKDSDPIVYQNGQDIIRMVDIGSNEFIEWAHQHDYDVWGLFRNEFDLEVSNKMLNNKDSRKKSIELLLEYTNKYKLDGINIDFENVAYSDRHVLTQFVRELAPVLREIGVVTSIDVTKIEPTSLNWSMCYDRESLGKLVDYMALMAYDQYGVWSKFSGSVAQYTWVENGLKGVLEQVPNEKVLLGLPFYTRVWEETNGIVSKTTAISMETAQRLIDENNAVLRWDEKSGQYFATYMKDNKTYKIWLEDVKSIDLKSSLVHKYNLPGVAGWRRGLESPEIWDILYRNLKVIKDYDQWLSYNQ